MVGPHFQPLAVTSLLQRPRLFRLEDQFASLARMAAWRCHCKHAGNWTGLLRLQYHQHQMAGALLNRTNGLYGAYRFDGEFVLPGSENGVPEARAFVEREIPADHV